MSKMPVFDPVIVLDDVSKWYGEVLGINRVSLELPRGITSVVGPNGCGKSTMLNIIAGLIRPSRGRVSIAGVSPRDSEALGRVLGYCPSTEAIHDTLTADEHLLGLLRIHGWPEDELHERVNLALQRVGLEHARHKKAGAYSKGMRQRLKLALSIAHEPQVLLLDEPLNGLDPLGREEFISLLQSWADEGGTILISSHVLHEVDLVANAVVMLHHGYVVAEGGIATVRGEIEDHPLQVTVTCTDPARLAERAFAEGVIRSAKVEGSQLRVETLDDAGFSRLVATLAASGELHVEGMELVDESVEAVYQYLIGSEATT
ncbi:MAG: ABC transporter ATP-binding protein [Acidobacteriota bacterium]